MSNKDIFYEVINEAKNGCVLIDNDPFPICFNTIINEKKLEIGKDYPTLNIKDEEEFFKYLDIYLEKELNLNRKHPNFIKDKEKNFRKLLISYLFVNSSITDFENPVNMLKRTISFIDDNTFEGINTKINLQTLLNSDLSIKNEIQSVMMETKNKMTFNLFLEDDFYTLPCISYGIDNDTCYIYSIMQDKKFGSKDGSYRKKINRLLYKLNQNVLDSETDEYKEYLKEKGDYYPENITDVTLSFILSLSLFIKLLENKNITKIKAVTYLPLRYLSRDEFANNDSLVDRNNSIQDNASNKFIRTFLRCIYHIEGIEILSLPYEVDEYLTLRINNTKNINNELLNDTIKKVI